MAIIYEVNLKVDASVGKEFKNWLAEHLDLMLQLPGFLRAEYWSELDPSVGTQGYCVRYELESKAAFERYVKEHAAGMRQEAFRLFGNQFQASRRLLKSEFIREHGDG
jgi:hypothetical protein